MSIPRGVLLLNPFDAHAGSQRIALMIVTALKVAGVDVSVRLGFGGRGFLSELPDISPDLHCNHIPTRKILYPLWALLLLIPMVWAASRGRIIWANTIYAILPALLAILLFPRRVIVHLHEATFPSALRTLLRLAARQGTLIVCVSADQRSRVGITAYILPNPVVQPACDPESRQDRLLFVGTTQPMKGFALFVSVCERLGDLPLRKAAYLSDIETCDQTLVATARAAGVDIVFGERSPEAMYRDGFLLLMCTDPQLVPETFSLVAAEAVTWLIPVGGAGTMVLPEILGDALAFDDPTRDPDSIAQMITDLHADRDRYTALRVACAERRSLFSETAFSDRLIGILRRTEAG